MPSIVTNVTVPLLGLVDLSIVGHIGNETMIGAIAVGSMIFNVMYWLMGFLRMGTTGMTANTSTDRPTSQQTHPLTPPYMEGSYYSQLVETQEESESKRVSTPLPAREGQGGGSVVEILRRYLRLALLIGGCFLLLQLPLRWLSVWLMGPSDEVAAYVRSYFSICIWGAPAMLSLYVMTGWFIGRKDTRTPMVISITQNLINIVASLVLVFGLKMQIEGVALGTLFAQWSGAAMAWGNLPRPLRKGNLPRLLRRRGGVGGSSSLFHINRDLFLRTLCLVAVNLFFTSAGARQSDLMLSVNTLLMTFFTLFSYVMDGFANAGEALCGRRSGEVVRHLFRWGWLMVVLFTVVYTLGGRGFLSLLTDEARVVDAAMAYLPWALLIPLAGMAAFVYDGIFVGMLLTRGMLISCAIATAAFFVLYFLLFPVCGNHALWLALIVYLVLRGVVQHVYLETNGANAAS